MDQKDIYLASYWKLVLLYVRVCYSSPHQWGKCVVDVGCTMFTVVACRLPLWYSRVAMSMRHPEDEWSDRFLCYEICHSLRAVSVSQGFASSVNFSVAICWSRERFWWWWISVFVLFKGINIVDLQHLYLLFQLYYFILH